MLLIMINVVGMAMEGLVLRAFLGARGRPVEGSPFAAAAIIRLFAQMPSIVHTTICRHARM